MQRSISASEKFVEAVYRRMIIFRTIEQLGLGMLLASLLAIVLNLLAIWQSMPTLPILLISGVLGLLCGGAMAVYRWPTRRAAVIEADRQLRFDDLLTSAIFSSAQTTDDFSQAVRAMADARCRLHSPGDVFLRKLDLRAWGGICVAMCVAFTLAVVPFGAQRSQAADVNSSVLTENLLATVKAKPSVPINNPASDGMWNDQSSTGEFRVAQGSGRGLSTSKNPEKPPIQNSPAEGIKNQSGVLATGGNASMNAGQRGDKPTGTQGNSGKSSNSTTPWHVEPMNANPASIVPANDATPAEDRDLIRDFFDGH